MLKKICLTLLFFSSFQSAVCAGSHRFDDVKPFDYDAAVLTVAAHVLRGDQDEARVPVAANFYLLPKSVVALLRNEEFQPVDENEKPLAGDDAFLEALGRAVSDPDDAESALLAFLIRGLIGKNQLAAVKTDLSGSGRSKALKTGNYYLFGYARVDDETLVWNLPVRVAPGANFIEIDQYNADAVVSVR